MVVFVGGGISRGTSPSLASASNTTLALINNNIILGQRYTEPGLVAFYDIQPRNGAGRFLQPWSPHEATTTTATDADSDTWDSNTSHRSAPVQHLPTFSYIRQHRTQHQHQCSLIQTRFTLFYWQKNPGLSRRRGNPVQRTVCDITSSLAYRTNARRCLSQYESQVCRGRHAAWLPQRTTRA